MPRRYVQSCVTSIGFPYYFEDFLEMAAKNAGYSPGRIVTDLDVILNFHSLDEQFAEWTAARWMTEGDILFFYHTNRGHLKIRRMLNEARREQAPEYYLAALERTLEQSFRVERCIFACAPVKGCTKYYQKEDWEHFGSRQFVPFEEVYVFENPLHTNDFAEHFQIGQSTVTPLYKRNFDAIKMLLGRNNRLPAYLAEVELGELAFRDITGENWRQIATGPEARFLNEAQLREYLIDFLLDEVRDPRTPLLEECETWRNGVMTGRADYFVLIDGTWIPVEAKLNIHSERDLHGQVSNYLNVDRFIPTVRQRRGEEFRTSPTSVCIIIDQAGVYISCEAGFIGCDYGTPLIQRTSIDGNAANLLRRAVAAALCRESSGAREEESVDQASESQPIRVDFLSSDTFPFLGRLGMTSAPEMEHLDESEFDQLQIEELVGEGEIIVLRLQVPAEANLPKSMEDAIAMAAAFERALRHGETVIVYCRDNPDFVGLSAACIAIAATDGELSASEAIELVRQARPGSIEAEAKEEFISEFEKEWIEVIAKRGSHYMLYWQERSVVDHATNGVPLDVVASNGLFGVEPGDTLWIVTLTQDREFLLAGRLVVGEIVEYEEAIRRMPDVGLWQAEYYAFPEPGTEELIRLVSLLEIAEELRFDGENDRLTVVDGQINPQQVRKRRKLALESAELVTSIWEESAPITDPEELIAGWQEVVEANPDEPEAHYNLGVALDEAGRSEEAIREYQETIRLDPNYFPALYNLGNYRVRSGQFDEAIEMFNRAILVDGDYAPAHFMLGVAYFESARLDDAIAATRQGLEIDPDDETAHYNIAYWTFRHGDHQEALALCDEIIARFPYYTNPHVLKGLCFRELGELDNEIQSYTDAVNIQVDDEGAIIINFTAVFFLGAAWERKITGSDEGIEYVEADNHFDLQDPTHQFYFAMGHLAQGDRDYADQWLEGLRTSAPDLARRLEAALRYVESASSDPHPTESNSLGNQQPETGPQQADLESDERPVDLEGTERVRKAQPRQQIQINVVGTEIIAKHNPDLYFQVLKLLVERGALDGLELPIGSGPKRNFLSRTPFHKDGSNFLAPVEFGGYYMESHSSREQGIRMLQTFLERLGIESSVYAKEGSPLEKVGPTTKIVIDHTEPVHETPKVRIDGASGASEHENEGLKSPDSKPVDGTTLTHELPAFSKPAGTNRSLRVVAWNCRSTLSNSPLWEYLLQLDPDVALLQDVRSYPPVLEETYTVREKLARHKSGHDHRFKTLLLAKGPILPLDLAIGIDWVDKELEYFSGNLIAGRIAIPEFGQLNVISVYSPPWNVPSERLKDIDISGVRQLNNEVIWVADLVLAMLRKKLSLSDESWIVGGDFNTCETFAKDAKEFLGKMSELGLKECLRAFQGQITPTFRHQRGIIRNQLDHLFVTKALGENLLSAQTPPVGTIFEYGFSDHSPIIADFEIK